MRKLPSVHHPAPLTARQRCRHRGFAHEQVKGRVAFHQKCRHEKAVVANAREISGGIKRLQGNQCGLRVIAISGYGGKGESDAGEGRGHRSYLVKPVDYSRRVALLNQKTAAPV
ncbi:hypothetical protein F6455_08815 [Proteobacteria bacterium 005FR1]|nr:hypothetical protein [Proteobacteria bacterium 005FR1]